MGGFISRPLRRLWDDGYVKPALSYYGGKQRLASKILAHINRIPHKVYTEPFAGGAALLFAKKRPAVSNNDNYREAINDIDGLISTFYRVAREQPDELQRRLTLTMYSQAEYRLACEMCKSPNEHDEITIAWAVYVNLVMSFANKMGAGWSTSTLGANSAVTFSSALKKLPAQFDRLRNVYIGNEDALRFIERFDSPDTLHYIDPPYPGTNQGHYGGYTVENWIMLCDLLDTIEGSYVLSNYAQEHQPASANERIEITATMSAAKNTREKRTEILWICNRSSEQITQSRMIL